MPSHRDLDAITIDALGTLVDLNDPTEPLAAALRERGVERTTEEVRHAFAAEAAYYVPRSHEGRDASSLARLRRECARVFLVDLDADLDPDEFARPFVDALSFRLVEGARDALDQLRAGGLALACVTNWDCAFPHHLEQAGVADRFAVVVTSAEAGAQKPDARIFAIAVERLDVPPTRALHIGDSDSDREGAHAAGLAFEPVPLATLPARLGL
ncbi:MAG: HAD-IA family hydrolase [Actinomycetota bacterium]|nr:HAD-IA family hydrolase [Actinomycetota bacterium]